MPRRIPRRARRVCVLALALAVTSAVGLGSMLWAGLLHPNNPSRQQYPVWGVDVSRYQGEIDWSTLADQGIEFAFIKATEGSSYVDPQFVANLEAASTAGVRAGAYHFFSFESSGTAQAEHIVQHVPKDPDLLPVAVDLEFYGQFWTSPVPVDDVRRELDVLLNRLKSHYRSRPVLYTTGEAYNRYISGIPLDADIWIRDVWRTPSLADGRDWTFWQFSDRHRLAGYEGEESFIDLNVFAGDRDAWQAYGR